MTITATNVLNLPDDGTSNLLAGATGMTSVNIGGTTYLYVAGYYSNALMVYETGPGGSLTPVQSIVDDATTQLLGLWTVDTVSVRGETYLATAGTEHGISVFQVGADGKLSLTESIADDATIFSTYPYDVITFELNDRSFVYTVGYDDNGVSAFELETDGTLTNLQNVADADNAAYELSGALGGTVVTVAGAHYLIVAGYTDDGLSVFQIDGNGTLTNVANVPDDASTLLNGVSDVTTAQVNGITYVYTGALNDTGLTIFRMDPGGALSFVGTVPDDAAQFTQGIWGIETIEMGGNSYIMSSSRTEYGTSLYRINDDGTLTNLVNIGDADNGSYELSGHYYTEIVQIDGAYYVYASGQTDNGVSAFRLDLPISISYNGKVVDMSETLVGAMRAAPAGSTITITDAALLDASLENVDVTQDDITVDMGTSGIAAYFYLSDYAFTFNVIGDGTAIVYGSDANGETISLGDGADEVFGMGGRDDLSGGRGSDWLHGGHGADTIAGGRGDDTVYGGAGNDKVYGSGGDDSVYVTNGRDWVSGGDGKDTLNGGKGDDTINGGDGNDRIDGGNDNDKLVGAAGNDRIDGSLGNDLLDGGVGKDTLIGDKGSDTLSGGGGNDTINGGAGNDRLYGQSGSDTFVFAVGDGSDRIYDFQDDLDQLDLDLAGLGYGSVNLLLNTVASQVGGNVILDFGIDGTIRIDNVQISDLLNDII